MSTKQKLIEAISEETGANRATALALINSFANALQDILLREGSAVVPGLGKVVLKARKARTGRNPRTGGTLLIAESTVAKLRPSQALKRSLAGKK